MPVRLIQCVPNFSEGRDATTVAAIVDAVARVQGTRVADYSADPDHHRMVLTFLGDPQAVVAGAMAGAREAVRRIDLTHHAGQHPRLGALDVLPFVPFRGVSMAECVAVAREAGEGIGGELGVPVYFYEQAAVRPDRVALPSIRRGGFEAIRDQDLVGPLAPDFGPARAHPTAGAVAVGARGPLIAFNVNLETPDVEVAHAVARRIRERDGGLAGIRALGMYLASRGQAQVSVNVTRPDLVSLHQVLESVRLEAARHDVEVAGTELVGTIRLEHLLAAAATCLGLERLEERQVLEFHAPDAPEGG